MKSISPMTVSPCVPCIVSQIDAGATPAIEKSTGRFLLQHTIGSLTVASQLFVTAPSLSWFGRRHCSRYRIAVHDMSAGCYTPPMATINRRIAASIEGDFVVFIIGARINRWWKLPKYLWFLSTMPKMIAEVAARPESGFLGSERLGLTTNVQYWRSLEQLIAYSRSRDQTHYPYWVRFNKEVASNGDIGIWHETFLVRAGEYECIYNNMPLRGLAKAAKYVDAIGRASTAAGRLGRSDGADAPIAVDGTEP